ncbi:MAG: hypothetical protein FWC16_14820 [Defluviitaleaceae bacterium]|nr:hypothetical protein [Defluviitaleaceae bacterium]MCL2276188.1 hypothetical protein [Defluviitaleaceae bacterium]
MGNNVFRQEYFHRDGIASYFNGNNPYMKILPLLFLLLLFTGCAADTPSPIVGTPRHRTIETVPAYAIDETEAIPVPIPYTVQFPQAGPAGTALALHEPEEGAYLGAWLSPDFTHITLRSFGNLAERQHAIFTYEKTLGDDVPIAWLLHAIASDAVPLFYLHVEEFSPFPFDALADLARTLGLYEKPMFLAFFPLTGTQEITAEEYIRTFRMARTIFRAYAPQTAFVWVAPQTGEISPTHAFYPGHDVVDWVGIPSLVLRGRDGFHTDITESFAPIHRAFQRYKPLMLLPFGVSHFSRIDYAYYIHEAAAEIERIYDALRAFPRLKAIIYRDGKNIGARWDDTTLTREREIMQAYSNAIACEHFLSSVINAPRQTERQWLRAAHHGYYYDGRLYIHYETLTRELSIPPTALQTEINGQAFVDTERLSPQITVCHTRRIIFVHLPS